jgi:HD-GYP domain-containing protein (c-di-GMP phosphodiesterase class II)
MLTNPEPDRTLWTWITILAILLIVLDLIAPPYIHFDVVYVGLVFASLWSPRRWLSYAVAAMVTGLILRHVPLLTRDSTAFWIETANCLLTICVLWGVAIVCRLRQQAIAAESRLAFENDNASRRTEEMAITTEVLREKNEQLTATRDVAVYTLAKVAESRDMDTGRHLERICAYSLILANELRKNPAYQEVITHEFLTNLRQSSPLHDIGKVSISDAILLKPGRLTPDEFEEMKKHTVVGNNILQDVISHKSEATFLKMAAVVANGHHERFDGQGYPVGLSGDAIPLPARIVALADVYDALTSERPYKKAYSPEIARDMILAESGGHFDPDVVDAFQKRFDDFVAVQRRYPNVLGNVFEWAESLSDESYEPQTIG